MNWNEIIPELKTWTPPISPQNLAASLGRYPLAIGYLTVFWPQFVEHEGMVFLGEQVDKEAVLAWLKTTNGNKQAVEAALNHFHVLDIQHQGIWSEATEPQVKFIAHTLKEAWAAKLAHDFPAKDFVVELVEGSSDKLMDYQIVFYQRSQP